MKNKKYKGKGPLLLTAALIVSCPIIMAEQAKALSTSAYGPSGSYTGVQPYQLVQKSPLGLLTQHQLGKKPSLQQTKLPYLSSSPFGKLKAQDLESAQAQLEQYKASLTTATNRLTQLEQNLNTNQDELKNSQNQLTAINAKISGLTRQISNQQNILKVANAETDRLSTLVASDSLTLQTLDAALTAQIQVKNEALTSLQSAQRNLTTATSELQVAQDTVSSKQTSYEVAQAAKAAAQANFQLAVTNVEEAGAQVDSKYAALQQATSVKNSKQDSLEVAQVNFERARTSYEVKKALADAARETYNQVVANYIYLLNVYTNVYDQYLVAQTNQSQAQVTLTQAQNTLLQAQQDYDTLLIPDPTWTPDTYQQEHTRLVATTTLVPRTVTTLTGGLTADVFNRQGYNNAPPLPTANEVPIATSIVSNINFQWGGGNVLNSGRSEDVIVRFTGNISFPTSGNYQFYSPADDGTILLIDGVQVTNDWRDKGGGGSTSAPIYFEAGSTHSITLYYYENGGGAAVWLYYYTPQTGYQIVPAAYLGTTATTETTYVEETTWNYETYYTTEIVPGQTHPLINDPALLPALQEAQATQQAALSTLNEVDEAWKVAQANQQQAAQDSTASYYQVIDTATTLNSLSAEADSSQVTSNELQTTLNSAQLEVDQATSNEDSTNEEYLAAQVVSSNATQDYVTASSNLDAATSNEVDAHLMLINTKATLTQALSSKETATSNVSSAQQDVDTATSKESDLVSQNQIATDTKINNESLLSSAQATASNEATKLTSYEELLTSAQEEESVISSSVASSTETINETQTNISSTKEEISSTKANITELEAVIVDLSKQDQGSAEIPEVIENLMDVDLGAVDPTELTEAQAEQLVEAALVAFETATEGSAEYEQALDALALAAQQDDIVVDEALAAIPGVGQAAQAVVAIFNLVGNVGADISPKKRKEAQNLVVTTLVVGQIAQAAALASASSGGSFRRK
jgi:hypothetical protein